MAYISIEERQEFYDTYPPGTRVLILKRKSWNPGIVIERYSQHGTVKIRYQLDKGEKLFILYGTRERIRIAKRAGPMAVVNMGFNSGDDESP